MKTQHIDLVVLASQGEAESNRWVLGSITQKVIRHSVVPVLIVRESETIRSSQPAVERGSVRILVALDGSALAQKVLKPAARVAMALSAPEPGELHLVQVLSFPEATSEEETTSLTQQRAIIAAQMYLHQTAQTLREEMSGKGACTVSTPLVEQADIAETLIQIAEKGLPATEVGERPYTCDVIALTTHGQSGIQRWVLGSVAEYLLDGTRLSLLVVRSTAPEMPAPS